jgi:hypothetical protein
MDWIIHLDTDELIHPVGTQEYSLRQLLSDVPGNVDMVIFPNYVSETALSRILFDLLNSSTFNYACMLLLPQESSVERDDIKEPFTEV